MVQEMARGTKRSRLRRRIIGSDNGVALLVVLWTLTILMVIVFSLSAMTRTESRSLLFFKQKEEGRFLAEAGIQRGIMEIARFNVYKNQQTVTEGSEPIRVDGIKYTGTLPTGSYEYAIQDESGKINLNALTDASKVVLINLFVNAGIDKEQADTIVDSILDWRDQDELVRLHGAESEYYASLPNPYKSKNANLDTVEEVLLVKGMTSRILYGTGKRQGVFSLLTVYSGAAAINVNTVSKEVLAALPGMTPGLVDTVLSLRDRPLRAAGALTVQGALGAEYAVIAPFVSVSSANIYTIEATGYSKAGGPGFTASAVVAVQSDGTYKFLHYKSAAGITQPGEAPRSQ
jgi:general secretion pathway protein K